MSCYGPQSRHHDFLTVTSAHKPLKHIGGCPDVGCVESGPDFQVASPPRETGNLTSPIRPDDLGFQNFRFSTPLWQPHLRPANPPIALKRMGKRRVRRVGARFSACHSRETEKLKTWRPRAPAEPGRFSEFQIFTHFVPGPVSRKPLKRMPGHRVGTSFTGHPGRGPEKLKN